MGGAKYGNHKRSLSETAMFRVKKLLGGHRAEEVIIFRFVILKP
ncbi:Mobile element protein [Candidatus Enterovibrio altilux]|uniref:Mobile element protein n=1 Tax=Candidatus Enterovibrio altilux TaxID=1927128 RepID=A0A291B9R3_9GAMM|nr:Mobile element protein [Candidatus Enterovibrio luxaltus]